jgi:hypothetical protein
MRAKAVERRNCSEGGESSEGRTPGVSGMKQGREARGGANRQEVEKA